MDCDESLKDRRVELTTNLFSFSSSAIRLVSVFEGWKVGCCEGWLDGWNTGRVEGSLEGRLDGL